jgi:cytochrome d ubiquinol oxidase subunit I
VGLDRFRREDRPPLAIPFLSYHVMIACGTFFVAITLLASVLAWRGTLFRTRWLLWTFVFAVVPAVVANQAGWVAAEVGRQPWIVHPPVTWAASGDLEVGEAGVVEYDESVALRTTDAVSRAVSAEQVLASLILFLLVYLLLGAMWIFLLDRKIRQGPHPIVTDGTDGRFLDVAVGRQGASLAGDDAAPGSPS